MSEFETCDLPRPAPAAVLACGAHLKNRACVVAGLHAKWSPPHGDLGDAEARVALERSVEALWAGSSAPIRAIAHDLHPDFYSTRVAEALAAQLGVPAIAVQHHHAHIAAVIAEHGLRKPVVGLALDGFGLGSDGSAWGGEVLRVEGGRHAFCYQRLAHLRPQRLPGGDIAAREPWRLAAALLYDLGRANEIETRFAPVVGRTAVRTVLAMLERDLNCPPSTSAGRWFDAAAGALGLSVRQVDEADAARALERCADAWLEQHPAFEAPEGSLDLRDVLAELLATDLDDGAAVGRSAALFHGFLASGVADAVIAASREQHIQDVVLGGGCFMNRRLKEWVGASLVRAGLRVHTAQTTSCGDAGLALGQAWVAAGSLAQGATVSETAIVRGRSTVFDTDRSLVH